MCIDNNELPYVLEKLYSGKIAVIYGKKGVGKTYSLKQYTRDNKNSLYIGMEDCCYTLKPLEDAICRKTGKCVQGIIQVNKEIENLIEGHELYTIVIDNFYRINCEIFLNFIRLQEYFYSEKMRIVLLIDCDSLNYETIDMLSNYDVIMFKLMSANNLVETEFKKVLDLNKYELKICVESSRNNMAIARRLALYLYSRQNSKDNICKLIERFNKEYIGSEMNGLDIRQKETISKSSLIGMKFDSNILKSEDTFKMNTVDFDLSDIEIKKGYVHKLEEDGIYEFEEECVHRGILNTIDESNQKDWDLVFANYYLKKSKTENIRMSSKYLENALIHLLRSKKDNLAIGVCFRLYRQYELFGDVSSEKKIINQLLKIESLPEEIRYYVLLQKMLLSCDSEDYQTADKTFKEISPYNSMYRTDITKKYLTYYNAYIMYNSGFAPKALHVLKSLENDLNSNLSKLNYIEKYLLCLVYSQLASSIKNLDDDRNKTALWYYDKALNISKNINKYYPDLYYIILRKCSMFFDPETEVNFSLKKCIEHFCETGNRSEHAKSLHNLATNMLFCKNRYDEILALFDESRKIIISQDNEDLSSVSNNMGILYFISGNAENAEKMFKESLLYNTETFSKYTALSNLFNLYISLKLKDDAEEYYLKIKKIYNEQTKIVDSNFMYKAYYLIDSYILEENNGASKEVLCKILSDLEGLCVTDFFKTILNDLRIRIGLSPIKHSCPYPLLEEFGVRKLFFAEILFWE